MLRMLPKKKRQLRFRKLKKWRRKPPLMRQSSKLCSKRSRMPISQSRQSLILSQVVLDLPSRKGPNFSEDRDGQSNQGNKSPQELSNHQGDPGSARDSLYE